MKERPILFSGAMVRAILDGQKRQTRRICKAQPPADALWGSNGSEWMWLEDRDDVADRVIRCPYGVVGDRLWVRETWSPDHERFYPHYRAVFRADDRGRADASRTECRHYAETARVLHKSHERLEGCACEFRWRPSIHMPRWASRITLEVTGVRVERLGDISEDDARAEGLKPITKDGGRTIKYGIPDRDGLPGTDDDGWPWSDWNSDPRVAFRTLWESINGVGSWAASPWVWVVEFKAVQP